MNNRFKLFLIWFLGFAICFLELLLLLRTRQISSEDLISDSGTLIGIFAPYLTTIVAFWFAHTATSDDDPTEKWAFRVACVCSVFYMLVIVILITSIFFTNPEENQVADTLKISAKISTYLTFLVGPAIGFFFGKVKK
jgi:hypothetical protein